MALLTKAVEGVLETIPSANPSQPPQQVDIEFAARYRECHLRVLKGLAEPRAMQPNWTAKTVTKVLMEQQRDELRLNVDGIEALARSRSVSNALFVEYLTNDELGAGFDLGGFFLVEEATFLT